MNYDDEIEYILNVYSQKRYNKKKENLINE